MRSVAVGPPTLDPLETIASWLASEDYFTDEDAVLADEAFGRFGAEQACALMTSLAERGCQVIYLTDDPEVLGWAIGLPHGAGGASTVSSACARKPRLLDIGASEKRARPRYQEFEAAHDLGGQSEQVEQPSSLLASSVTLFTSE